MTIYSKGAILMIYLLIIAVTFSSFSLMVANSSTLVTASVAIPCPQKLLLPMKNDKGILLQIMYKNFDY